MAIYPYTLPSVDWSSGNNMQPVGNLWSGEQRSKFEIHVPPIWEDLRERAFHSSALLPADFERNSLSGEQRSHPFIFIIFIHGVIIINRICIIIILIIVKVIVDCPDWFLIRNPAHKKLHKIVFSANSFAETLNSSFSRSHLVLDIWAVYIAIYSYIDTWYM